MKKGKIVWALKAPKRKLRIVFFRHGIRYFVGDYKHRRSAMRAAQREWRKTNEYYRVYDDKGHELADFIPTVTL